MTFQEKLIKMDACEPAVEWVGSKTLREAWDTCERADWMLWLLRKAGCDLRTLTHCKVVCAEYARDKMTDPRSIAALNGAWAFVRGEISEEELERLAADADAYYAADAAAAYAYYAAYAAAYAYADAAAAYHAAAHHAAAHHAASSSCYVFADAAAAAAAAAAAYAGKRYEILSQMANDIRKIVNADFVEKLVQNSAR